MNSYLLKRKVCSLLRVKPGRDFEVAFRELSIVRVRKEDEFLKLRRDNVIFFHPLEKLKHALQIMYIIFMIFALPLFFALSAMTENILIVGGHTVCLAALNQVRDPMAAIRHNKLERKLLTQNQMK